ncbi:MAG: hypothetical protein KAR45_19140, partial [Desulfobacteraceae bacterium]|nr:hypothetical protein [Desulfobacteraceae bacterium]
KKEKKKEKLIDKNKGYHKTATRLANIQEKASTNLIKISAKMDSVIENSGKKEDTAKLETTFNTLKNEEKKINKKLKSCFDKIDDIEKQLKGVEDSFSETKQTIDDLRQERKHLAAWNDANQGDTTIKITGVVFPGTIVQGRYSEKQIKDKLINAKIKELMYQSDDDKKRRHQYEMIIT